MAPPKPQLARSQLPTQLLQSPDFENGAVGWVNTDSIGRALDASKVHTGAWSLHLRGTSAGELAVYQDVTATAGDTFDVDGWVATDSLEGSGATLEVLWLDAPALGDSIPPANLLGADTVGVVTGTTDWTRLTRSVTAPAGAVVARVVLRSAVESDSVGTAYFDDLSMELVPPGDVTPPTVAITSPAASAVIRDTTTLSADAADVGGVVGVQFLMDGVAVDAELVAAPYTLTYATDSLADGAHAVTARARDGAGNSALSPAIDVRVDHTPPAATITAPLAGASLGGTVTLSATATDNERVAVVQFLVDGTAVGSEVTAAPYTISYQTDSLLNGSHLISARAADGVGRTGTSPAVSVIVNNPPPRDVVVMVSDDQRFDQMPYMPLTTAALRNQTVRFTKGFVTTSLCCPSRSSLLTGQYAHNHGVLTNVAPTGGATKFDPTNTLATQLQAAGYRTALIGKYMNQYELIAPAIPPGWSDFEALMFGPASPSVGYEDYQLNTNGAVAPFGPTASDYSTDVLAARAIQFIQTTPTRKPLFLLFTPFAPHVPALPYPSDVGKYATFKNWRPPSFNETDVSDKPTWIKQKPKISASQMASSDQLHRSQLESLQAMDRAINNIIATLKASGRWSNTLVVYFSDNGYMWGEHRLVDRKQCPYEECIRVPFWVRAPGLVFRTDTSIVANIDIAPTASAWTGVPLTGRVNGINLMPLLQNQSAPWRTELLIEQLGQTQTNTNSSGVRDARYFYNEYQNGETEFYDLKTDPYQLVNTVTNAANKNLIASLKAKLAILKVQ